MIYCPNCLFGISREYFVVWAASPLNIVQQGGTGLAKTQLNWTATTAVRPATPSGGQFVNPEAVLLVLRLHLVPPQLHQHLSLPAPAWEDSCIFQVFQRRAWIGGNVCQEVSELRVHWNWVRCYKVRSTFVDAVLTSFLIMIFVILSLHDQYHDWMKLYDGEKLSIKSKWSLQLCHVVLCLLGQW